MSLIDLSNYDTTLAQSTAGRVGNINGNIRFDTTGKIEYLDATEAPFINLTNAGTPTGTPDVLATAMTNTTYYMIKTVGTTDFTLIGAASNTVGLVFQATGAGTGTGTGDECTANPLIEADGIKLEAVYAFENQERAVDEVLRGFDRWTAGSFKFAGAYVYVNGRTPSTAADRKITRGSGWDELDTSDAQIQIHFGAKGLSNIEPASQPYYQLDLQGTAVNFTETGQIDESVLVYRDDNGDGSPDEDNRTYMATSIRTYGKTHDRKETTTDLGITELGGYSTGFALDEQPHLTTDPITNHPYANVYGTPIGVWVAMELNHIPAPSAKVGEFEDETGSRLFSWELINANSADLDEMVAWLDAFAASTDEADGLAVNTGHLGKDIETWYSYNAAGKVVSKSGVDPSTEGLYFQNVPTADQQRILMTDDSGTLKNYEFEVSIEAEIGSTAKGDANAWYHAFEAALYNTAGAVTLQDSTPADVSGLASTADADNKIIFAKAYTSDLDCVFLCEGDGGATQAKTLFTIVEQTTVAFACIPGVENNV